MRVSMQKRNLDKLEVVYSLKHNIKTRCPSNGITQNAYCSPNYSPLYVSQIFKNYSPLAIEIIV